MKVFILFAADNWIGVGQNHPFGHTGGTGSKQKVGNIPLLRKNHIKILIGSYLCERKHLCPPLLRSSANNHGRCCTINDPFQTGHMVSRINWNTSTPCQMPASKIDINEIYIFTCRDNDPVTLSHSLRNKISSRMLYIVPQGTIRDSHFSRNDGRLFGRK